MTWYTHHHYSAQVLGQPIKMSEAREDYLAQPVVFGLKLTKGVIKIVNIVSHRGEGFFLFTP